MYVTLSSFLCRDARVQGRPEAPAQDPQTRQVAPGGLCRVSRGMGPQKCHCGWDSLCALDESGIIPLVWVMHQVFISCGAKLFYNLVQFLFTLKRTWMHCWKYAIRCSAQFCWFWVWFFGIRSLIQLVQNTCTWLCCCFRRRFIMVIGLSGIRCRSVVIQVITKLRESDLLITSLITDRPRTTRSPITN